MSIALACTGLLACLPLARGEYTSTEVTLPRLCGGLAPGPSGARALEGELVVAGARFAVTSERGKLRVATQAGAEPKQKLDRDGEVTLEWRDDLGPQRCVLRLERDGGEAWSWGPARARRFELPGAALHLVDADLDGAYGELRDDGWCLEPGGPLLPFARSFVVGTNLVALGDVALDGARLEARVTPLAGTPAQLAVLARLNELRASAGLLGVAHEGALSVGCSEHASYLMAIAWDGAQPVNEQDPDHPLASRGGRAAAQAGVMARGRGVAALERLWAAPASRARLLDPDLVRVGVSDGVEDFLVLDVGSRDTHGQDPALRLPRVVLSPCDRGVLTDTKGAWVARSVEGHALSGYAAKLWRVDGKEPKEVELELVDGLAALGAGAFRPRAALARGIYVVEHELRVEGVARTARAVVRVR